MYDSNFHTFQNQCLQIKVHFCPSLINKLADTLALVSFFYCYSSRINRIYNWIFPLMWEVNAVIPEMLHNHSLHLYVKPKPEQEVRTAHYHEQSHRICITVSLNSHPP